MTETLYSRLIDLERSQEELEESYNRFKSSYGEDFSDNFEFEIPSRRDILEKQREVILGYANNNPTLQRSLCDIRSVESRLLELDDVRGVLDYLHRKKDHQYYSDVAELGELISVEHLTEKGLAAFRRGFGATKGIAVMTIFTLPLTFLTVWGSFLPVDMRISLRSSKYHSMTAARYLDKKLEDFKELITG